MPICFFDSPVGLIMLGEEGGKLTRIHFVEEKKEDKDSNEWSPVLEKTKEELLEYFDGRRQEFSFLQLLGQTGSEFQARVWHELQEIPFGATISYRELALRLGDEKCIRAAASANGQNNLAIVVPCHRVIGSDGSLTGYAGGLWRKKWLLEHEAKLAGKPVQGVLF